MKKLFENKAFFRYLFVIMALIIGVGSLFVSRLLTKDLEQEELRKIQIWAEATKELASSDENVNVNLIMKVIESNKTIPVILYDKAENYFYSTNIKLPEKDEQDFLRRKVQAFTRNHEPIPIGIEGVQQYLFYDDSYTLKRLQAYPYVQLGVLAFFIIIAGFAMLNTKRQEQDRIWVGLSKETAHQLGTPLSSLLAWLEYLKLKNTEESIVADMEKDVNRLQMIADRFSKIGSKEVLEIKDVRDVLLQTILYMEKRMSTKVTFYHIIPSEAIVANINEPLLGWVIENLTKNAVDAMEGIGEITYVLEVESNRIHIDIIDTGKGIPKSKFRTIFNPGYSTKTRGWGLGLSLAKRIVESYHRGRIYVRSSDPNVGSTFRIELKRH